MTKINLIAICLLLFGQINAQTNIQSDEQKTNNTKTIKNLIYNYFLYDRENIHVQFNKNTYINNEYIAFKGYVWNKNNNTPYKETTNVQLVIYDIENKIIQKQLLYTLNGTFTGGLHLNKSFKSGKYFFHFYTNWMNNFNEDDSFTQEIEIINPNQSYQITTNEPNWKTAKVEFFPEGGTIINEINNTVGIKITDCNKKGIAIQGGILLDSKQNEITTFNTNKNGHGLFYFIPDQNKTYSIKIKSDKLELSQPLPKVTETGIAITYNNNLPKNILAVAIKTNNKGLETYQNKKLNLIIQQENNFIQKEIQLNNEPEKTILFDKKNFSNGVHIIRLLDEDLNQLTERLVFNYNEHKNKTNIEIKALPNDSILVTGKTDIKNPNLSLSILPENNICIPKKNCLFGTYFLNAYLEQPETDNYTYFDPSNNSKKQEMELLMLNQSKSKYKWENIKNNPPKMAYTFNKGVTIGGKIDRNLNSKSDYKISLINIKKNVFEETNLDEKNEFKFENFYAQDSTVFLIQLVNKKNNTKYTKIEAKVWPNETTFLLPKHFEKSNCPIEIKPEETFTFSQEKGENSSIKLDEITVKGVKKEMFKYQNQMSPSANSFKIKDNNFGSLLSFINANGYKTGVDPETHDVFINDRRSFNEHPQPPFVYIDNQIILDFNMLFSLNLQDIDEIYIDKSGASDVGVGGNGTIKIFLKEAQKNNYYNIKHTSLIVTEGFSKEIPFKNTVFDTQKEFLHFGTLHWNPNFTTNEKNCFEIKSIQGNQKEVQVLLEGFSPQGELISEIQKIKVQE